MVVAHDVDGHDGILGVLQDALQGTFGRGLHGGVDLLGGHGLLQLHREVDHGAVGGGNAGGEAVETALELGEHEGHGTGGTGGGGDHRHGGSAGAAQILMGKIEDLLVVGVGVNGVHVAALDAEVLQQHLGEGSQAVGGAGGVRDDVVHLGVVLVVVDAHDDGDVLVLGRAGNDDLLGAGIQVLLRQLAGLEDAGGLYDHIHTQLAPGQVRRIAVGKHGHVLAIHHQAVIRHFDIKIADAVDGVVLQQVSSGGFVAQIVDGDHLDRGIVGHGAEDEASDATESVDAYLGCHAYLLSQDTRKARWARISC